MACIECIMINVYSKKIEEGEGGQRLDVFLAAQTGKSRSLVQKEVKRGDVTINGNLVKKTGTLVGVGDVVEVVEKKLTPTVTAQPKEEVFDYSRIAVVAESDDYVVVHKPSGLLVHQTPAEEPHTLVTWLMDRYPQIENIGDSPERPGIVHRLDKAASGVMVVAKTQKMFDHLKQQFKDRTVEKEYTVLVYGNVGSPQGRLDFLIERGKEGRMAARPKQGVLSLKNIKRRQTGKEALTEFWMKKEFSRFTLLRVKIHTGRTHQIRVHMLAYNHPVVGDPLYAIKRYKKKSDEPLRRLFLHATTLSFMDLTGNPVTTHADLPEELQVYLDKLT